MVGSPNVNMDGKMARGYLYIGVKLAAMFLLDDVPVDGVSASHIRTLGPDSYWDRIM